MSVKDHRAYLFIRYIYSNVMDNRRSVCVIRVKYNIKLSEKFLSFYKEIIDAQFFFVLY